MDEAIVQKELKDADMTTHVILQSESYESVVDLIWSEIFINQIADFDNKKFSDTIQAVKDIIDKDDKSSSLSTQWFVIKELTKKMTWEQIKAASHEECKNLVESIKESIFINRSEERFLLEDKWTHIDLLQ